jgi:hypothetical protein
MIYHNQNKDDDRMLKDLEHSDKQLRARDQFERNREYDMDYILPLRTPVDDGKRIPNFGSHEVFELGVELSKVSANLIPTDAPLGSDSETGYQNYQDFENEQVRMKRYNIVPHGGTADHIPSEFTNLLSIAYFTRQRMLEAGACEVHIYDNVEGKFWDNEGRFGTIESESDLEQARRRAPFWDEFDSETTQEIMIPNWDDKDFS